MEFTFENQGTNTYLVYTVRPEDEIDSMSLGMLTNNKIDGLAPAQFSQMDTEKYIKYNVSAKVSATQLLTGPVNKKRMLGVFNGLINAMLSAEEYMLDPNSLLLTLEYIFVDVSTCETTVICLPIMNVDHKNPDLRTFFKNIIFTTQFDQTENCDHVAQILNYLNSAPVLSLNDFKAILERIGNASEPVKPAQPKVVASEPAHVVPQVTQPVAPAAASAKPAAAPETSKYENLQFGTSYIPVGQVSHAKPDKAKTPQAPQVEEEKPMTMFYLLQHYSKENAAIYKAQQEAKKAKKAGTAAPAAQPVRQKTAPKQPGVSFAIPGKQERVNPGFEVPGQSTIPVTQQPVQPVKTGSRPVVPKEQPAPTYQQPAPAYQQPVQPSRPINFGETTVLGGGIGETTVLDGCAEPSKVAPHLIRVKNNERIPLNKPIFRIGKERSYVDYFVSDNTAISRSHANIVNHDGEFFVVDTNSTNHTYVNGGMIPSNVETKLSHGTKIRFANEDFEFRLY